MLNRTPLGKHQVVRRYLHGSSDTSNSFYSGPASIVYSESGHRADEDEPDISEDDYAPSRSASVAPSRSHSVAASRAHSRESLASGTRTPLGASRGEATFIEVQDRSRMSIITQAAAPAVPPAPTPAEQGTRSRTMSISRPAPPTSTADRSIRESERERTVSTASKVSTIAASTVVRESERERTVSTASKVSAIAASTVVRDRKSSTASRISLSISQPPSQPTPPAVSHPVPPVISQPIPPSILQPVPPAASHVVHPAVETREPEPVTKGKGKKTKTPKTSIPPSPIDPADTTVGKSPGKLAETLTSVWGSTSKANTPGASPLIQTSKSIGPTTPKTEDPPPLSHKVTPKMADVKLSEPSTPALQEAQSSLPADASSAAQQETSRELSVEITQETRQEGPPSSTTPADTAPPEASPAQTPRDLAAIAEAPEPPAEQPKDTDTWTEIQPNVLGIDIPTLGGLELDITPAAPAEPANDIDGDGSWGGMDNSWNFTAPNKSANSTPSWGASSGGGNVGWGSTTKSNTARGTGWSMPAAPTFGGIGSTIAGTLGGILSHSPRPSPKPLQSSLPADAERPPSLGGLGSTLAESLGSHLMKDGKKSPMPSPRPKSILLPAAQTPASVETAPVDVPAAPAQVEEPPVSAEAPTQAADEAPPATTEEPIPVEAAADKPPGDAAVVEPPAAAPGETGDGEGNDEDKDKEEAESKKLQAPVMKASNSKGGKKKKKK